MRDVALSSITQTQKDITVLLNNDSDMRLEDVNIQAINVQNHTRVHGIVYDSTDVSASVGGVSYEGSNVNVITYLYDFINGTGLLDGNATGIEVLTERTDGGTTQVHFENSQVIAYSQNDSGLNGVALRGHSDVQGSFLNGFLQGDVVEDVPFSISPMGTSVSGNYDGYFDMYGEVLENGVIAISNLTSFDTVHAQNGFQSDAYSGGGNRYLCVDNDGVQYADVNPCV